jgi:hypothetical protein
VLKTQFTLDFPDRACYSHTVLNALVRKIDQPAPLPDNRRSIHLVDIENLVGSSVTSRVDVARVRSRYDALAGVVPGDHVVIATGKCAASAAWFGWGPARRLLGPGIDGADRALLEVIECEQLVTRYQRVVVASGDGIFADACALLQSEGCAVTVVTRPEALSKRLRLAVRDIRLLYYLPPTSPIALDSLRRAA